MRTYIALVRHGVTDWNYDGRAQGQSDIPLNAEGLRQVEAAGERLAAERWDAVYSSDLGRARDTALAVCQRTGHELMTDERLRERQMGLAEGTTVLERRARWPGVPFAGLPGMEDDEQLGRRGQAVFTEIARRHAGQRVLIVAHGGLIKHFQRLAIPGVEPDISRNTGITPVVYDGESFTLAGPHDYRHLLVDGVEYSGEKYRLIDEVRRTGLPGVPVEPREAESLLFNSTAVESAWVDGRLVGYARAFTDATRTGYVDLLHVPPGFAKVGDVLLRRLELRFPQVRFQVLADRLEEATGA